MPGSPFRGVLLDDLVIVSISGSTGDFPFRLPWMASDPLTVTAAIAGSVFLLRRPPFASTSSHFGRERVRLVRGRFVAVLEESADIVEADRECILLVRSSVVFPLVFSYKPWIELLLAPHRNMTRWIEKAHVGEIQDVSRYSSVRKLNQCPSCRYQYEHVKMLSNTAERGRVESLRSGGLSVLRIGIECS